MAIADLIPTLWVARFTLIYYYEMVWGMLANRTYEGQIRQRGDTVKIPTYDRLVTVNDYVVGTPMVAPQQPTGTTQDLVINKQKYFRVAMEDIHRVQSAPDLFMMLMQDAARKMAETVDGDIQTPINTALGALGAGKYERLTDAYTASGLGKKVVLAFVDAKTRLDQLNVPAAARWAVINPRTMGLINRYFLDNENGGLYVPVTNESTLRNGFMGRLVGFNLMSTTNTPENTVATKKYDRIAMGQGNAWTSHAEQISSVEAYRPDDSFQDAVKALMVYGTKNVSGDYYTYIEHRQDAA